MLNLSFLFVSLI